MRIGIWALAAIGVAIVSAPARAQTGLTTTPLGGPSPSTVVNKPIDVSALAVVPAMATTSSKFNLTNFFRRISIPGFNNGVSPLPGPSSFPKYPSARMIGAPPTLIGDPKSASPFQPVMPITMTVGQ
jgi:hypothetical protein